MARRGPLELPPRYRVGSTCRSARAGSRVDRARTLRGGFRWGIMNAQYRFGPLLSEHGVTFRLWAPGAREVELLLLAPEADVLPMHRHGDWFEVHATHARGGTRYQFRIDGDLIIPDPISHFQPDDVNGASAVTDHGAYQWRARDWKGLPWEQAVFLEAHVGTFTAEGSFRSMMDRLDHLAKTG